MKKVKTGYWLVGVFALLIGLLIALNFINKNNEKRLTENGIEAIAKITKIDVNNYKANELEGKYVENYILTFNFTVNDQEVKSIRTVEKKEYKKYFDRSLRVDDQITILYDPSNPKNNKIKELEKN